MKCFIRRTFAAGVAEAALCLTPTATTRVEAGQKSNLTILQTASAVNAQTGEFSTLIAAVGAADLAETLNGRQQFAVFAPTDAAFLKLGLTAENVVKLPKDFLTKVLLLHVTHGHRLSQSVVNARQLTMLPGDKARISAGPGIENAKVTGTDVRCSNGVIHIIDTVILPPGLEPEPCWKPKQAVKMLRQYGTN